MTAIIAREAAALAQSPACPLCGTGVDPHTITLPGILIDLSARRAWAGGREAALSRKEFDLFVYLARRPGVVVTKQQIYSAVWGYAGAPQSTRTVESHISRLRRKLDHGTGRSASLASVWGIGWRLVIPD